MSGEIVGRLYEDSCDPNHLFIATRAGRRAGPSQEVELTALLDPLKGVRVAVRRLYDEDGEMSGLLIQREYIYEEKPGAR